MYSSIELKERMIQKTNSMLHGSFGKFLTVFFIFISVPLLGAAQAVMSKPNSFDFVIPPASELIWGVWNCCTTPPGAPFPYYHDAESLVTAWNSSSQENKIRNCVQGDPFSVEKSPYTITCHSFSPYGFDYGSFAIVAGYCDNSTRLINKLCASVSDTVIIPSKNVGKPCNCVGNPINPGFGNKFQAEQDYAGIGLVFERYYDSNRDKEFPSTTLGGWRHYFDRRIAYGGYQTPKGIVYAIQKDGKSFRFVLTDGKWIPDADVSDQLQQTLNSDGSVAGWRYQYDANKIDTFNATGRLISISERNGYTQNLTYSDATTPMSVAPAPGLLITVTDSFGRKLSFTYDTQSRIATMTVPDGGVYQYGYDANNNLRTVTMPDQTIRRYVYENQTFKNLLTGIIDENGNRFATWSYDTTGRAISSEHAGGVERVTLAYNGTAGTVVTDARGTASTYGFQNVQGVVKTNSVQSPVGTNATAYDVNGNVTTENDRNGNITTHTYDLTRNLEVQRVEASGIPQARTISTQWHATYRLPVKVAEPLRLTTYAYDSAGNLLTKTEQATTDAPGTQGFNAPVTGTPRTWSYTYNQYGQVLTVTDPLGNTTTNAYDSQGNLASITNAAGHVTTLSNYDANGRVGRIVDQNGLTTDLTYSPRGWLTSKKVGSELTTYDYDGVGQLKKVTNPDGSFIAYTYDAAHRLTDIADSGGNNIHYTLDAMGNRITEQVKDPTGTLTRQITRIYDALNQLQKVTGGA